jgi:FkbM family methyltransferase
MTINDYLISIQSSNPNGILDIGANVGEFSLFCKRIWPSADILMIEGNDNCEDDLIRTNLPYKIALLGNINKKVNFYINKENMKCTGSSYYKEVTHHYDDTIIIEKDLVRLDDITSDKFDIIKIDTQGSELDIIKGGLNVIKNAKYVILEVATKQYNQGSPLFDEVVSYMESIGFKNQNIIENHIWKSTESNEFRYGDIFQVDVIFSK